MGYKFDLDFSDALKEMKKGKVVTCERWNRYVEVGLVRKDNGNNFLDCDVLMLHDRKRGKVVIFTPSVENMFSDKWRVIVDKVEKVI